MSEPERIEFFAYLPPIQTAIMVSGEGDLLQVKLNVNLTISPNAARLLMMTGKRLKVTVREVAEPPISFKNKNDANENKDDQDKGTKRKQRYPYHD